MNRQPLCRHKVLFEERDWILASVQDAIANSYVAHNCMVESDRGWRWETVESGFKCSECQQTPSDNIVTLYWLHNFDKVAGH